MNGNPSITGARIADQADRNDNFIVIISNVFLKHG